MSIVGKYRKKPVTVKAIQWTDDNFEEVVKFIGSEHEGGDLKGTYVFINTLEGVMIARRGDYIIRGVKNECYPCKQDIFEETYDLIEIQE